MCFIFFFFKQKTAYEMRISDWSSDVCSSDLRPSIRRPWCAACRSRRPRARWSTPAAAGRPGRGTNRRAAPRELPPLRLSLADRYAHLLHERPGGRFGRTDICIEVVVGVRRISRVKRCAGPDLRQKRFNAFAQTRSEEHTSELQSLMRTSYAVFCL